MSIWRSLLTLTLAALPAACVIDGVPLPDETDKEDSDQTPADSAAEVNGVYATLAAGITVVFGVPGVTQANATVVVLSGSAQAQAATAANGSFNVALIGDITDTIDVRVLVGSKEVGHTTVRAPRLESQTAPDGVNAAPGNAPAPTKADTSSTRVGADSVKLEFPAGSFPTDASVAIANIDRGTTETASARADGGLTTTVAASRGETLYIITITADTATAPYVITAP